jgi:tRNA A-37 threonylcarbamoyl transferase component Bud32
MRVGDYTVERELADGVYEATHLLLPRRVVLRVVGPDRAGALQVMREACILEALRHPGVPRMFECGRSGDRTWIAVERIEGDHPARLGIDAVIALVRDLAGILDHAHARGVTHGNVCRETIVLRASGPCLIAWGGARLAPHYASDVLALGELASALTTDPAPAAFGELLAEMCAADPRRRPTAAEVAAAAARIAAESIEELDDVDLVEIDLPPPVSIPTPVPVRWTPATGISTAGIPGAKPIAQIKLRS